MINMNYQLVKWISHYKLLKHIYFLLFYFVLCFILQANLVSQFFLTGSPIKNCLDVSEIVCPGHVRRRKCTGNTVCMESLLKTCMTCRNQGSTILEVQILSGKFRVEFHFGRSVYVCVVSVQCVFVVCALCVLLLLFVPCVFVVYALCVCVCVVCAVCMCVCATC